MTSGKVKKFIIRKLVSFSLRRRREPQSSKLTGEEVGPKKKTGDDGRRVRLVV